MPERSIGETWDRVAGALAAVEPQRREEWRRAFRAALDDFKFLPAGRILAGAGTAKTATLANCFAAGPIEDSIDGIFDRLKETAITMRWGGGVGCDFSRLPPRGPRDAGPLAYLRIWDAMCESVSVGGARRGAMIGTLHCSHPDIEQFIGAKRDGTALRNFNLSVLLTDDFMAAVAEDRKWPLRFPCESRSPGASGRHVFSGGGDAAGAIVRVVKARELWNGLVTAAYESAEPGVLFIDRINRSNNLHYAERISTTNPCAEIPLPPHGVCVLGSLNVTAFVRNAFEKTAALDLEAIEQATAVAVRMLDDAVDVSLYPLPEQAEQARATRRIGLGITGLADAFVMLDLRYDSVAARKTAQRLLTRMRDAAYRTSTELAAEKGAFPLFDREAYLDAEYVRGLPSQVRDQIARRGMRNSHLLAIAPAGTISLLAHNVSSGIEPIFSLEGERRMLDEYGVAHTHAVRDRAFALWCEQSRGSLRPAFLTAAEVEPVAHLEMVSALQPLVDNAISKTINVPAAISRDEFAGIFERAYALGVKGCTVFRPNSVTGAVLTAAGVSCCRRH